VATQKVLPEPGERNFACGANYPHHQALKGGYFVFVCGGY